MFWRNRIIRRICVICLSSKGDIIQASAPLKSLKDKYPDARITFVVAGGYEEAIEHSPVIDELIVFGRSKSKHISYDSLPSITWRLFLSRFDLLVDLQGNQRTRLMSFCSLPFKRTSVLGNYSNLPKLERYRYFMNRLGILGDLPPTETWLGDDVQEFADNFLGRAGIMPQDFLVGLNPGVDYITKLWPPEFFAQVGNYFSLAHGAKTIVFGSPDDRDRALNVYQLMDKKPILAAGRTSFQQTGAMIARCNLFFTGDTALMQLARGLTVPSIVIFGGTDPEMSTTPIPDFMRVIRNEDCPPCYKPLCNLKTRECLWAVRPDQVIEEAESVLGLSNVTEVTSAPA